MNAPLRNRNLAVFDVDETLIDCKSMFDFLQFALRRTLGRDAGGVVFIHLMEELQTARETAPREAVNRLFYSKLEGWRIADLEQLAEQWFQHRLHQSQPFFLSAVLAALRQHQAAGDDILFLSGSARFILAPMAQYLGVRHMQAIELELALDGASLTGNIAGLQTIGDGKAEALARFLNSLPARPGVITGYGDHESDLPFLRKCERQRVVTADCTAPLWTSGLSNVEFLRIA